MDRSHFPVVIIGGGQAGLSVSYCLKQRDIAHIIFLKSTSSPILGRPNGGILFV